MAKERGGPGPPKRLPAARRRDVPREATPPTRRLRVAPRPPLVHGGHLPRADARPWGGVRRSRWVRVERLRVPTGSSALHPTDAHQPAEGVLREPTAVALRREGVE